MRPTFHIRHSSSMMRLDGSTPYITHIAVYPKPEDGGARRLQNPDNRELAENRSICTAHRSLRIYAFREGRPLVLWHILALYCIAVDSLHFRHLCQRVDQHQELLHILDLVHC